MDLTVSRRRMRTVALWAAIAMALAATGLLIEPGVSRATDRNLLRPFS